MTNEVEELNEDQSHFNVLPSNPADRKKIKQQLHLITAQMQLIGDGRSAVKDIIDLLFDEYKIPKKVIRKLAKTMYDSNYVEVSAENTQFEVIYETLNEIQIPVEVVETEVE